MFDYVIVGGGPCGLTLAWCLLNYNKKVLLIEKEDYLGGCHGVTRVNGIFSEHGPRIYLDNYLTFIQILKEMNLSWHDLFTPYEYSFVNIGTNTTSALSFPEIMKLLFSFMALNESYKVITMEEYLNNNNFSEKAKNYLDRLCRLTDGAGIDRYTLYNFLQLPNQNSLYTICQPKKPNDIGLFKYWKDNLLQKGLALLTRTKVNEVRYSDNKVTSIITDKEEIYGKNFIFAIPPVAFTKILQKSNIENAFGKDIVNWSNKTNYITYIPVTFHWNTKLDLPKIWGFPETSWGIVFIVLSDYMKFEESKTVITVAITRNNKSDYTNKTPDETSDRDEIIIEIFRQLKIAFPDISVATKSVMSQNYYKNKRWNPEHNAFITTKHGYIKNKSNMFDNLYNCGTQNGKSNYSFTSLESATSNAVSLINQIMPESKERYRILKPKEILNVIKLIIFLIIITLIILYKS